MLAAAKPNKFITLNRKDLRKMENENINTNATDTQMNSTNESKSESFANEALTANTNYGTISSADIENGTAELVLNPPFADDGEISVACVGGECDELTDVSAMGPSGIPLQFKNNWTMITLKKGMGAKNGEYNNTAYLFRYNLIQINDIYASLSRKQREAMAVLVANNFIDNIIGFHPNNLPNDVIDVVKKLLSDCGLVPDFEFEIKIVIFGLYELYEAEQRAISYYNLY